MTRAAEFRFAGHCGIDICTLMHAMTESTMVLVCRSWNSSNRRVVFTMDANVLVLGLRVISEVAIFVDVVPGKQKGGNAHAHSPALCVSPWHSNARNLIGK